MEINVQKKENSTVEIDLQFSQQDLLPYKEKVLKKLQANLEIDGFRKSKAPLGLVEKKFSPLEIYEKALNEAVEEIYPSVLKEKNIRAMGVPEIKVTKIIPDKEAEVKIQVAYLSEFSLPDYKSIAAEKNKEKAEVKVEDKDIEETLKLIQDSYASYHPLEREARKEDLVTIDFQIFEGDQLIPNGEDKNYSFILGKGNFLPGFEEQIIGMKVKEEKTFNLPVPQDWPDENLKGKELLIKVVLKEVKEKKLPEFNADFLKQLGEFSSLEELKNILQKDLLTQKKEKEKERIRAAILDTLIEKTNLDIPEILIKIETERMVEELKLSLERIQLTLEQYLAQIKKTEEQLRNDFRELAQKRVKARLILEKIAEEEKIQINEQEKINKIEEIFNVLSEEEQKNINPEALKEYAEEILKNEKVFQLLENQDSSPKE